MPVAHLTDRGVVKVSGPEAHGFLDGLVTCDIDKVDPARARLGALLTPQGKILFDFLIFRAPGDEAAFFLDCHRPLAGDLVRRLAFYKLRAKVTIEDRSETLAVLAGWDAAQPDDEIGLVTPDPRLRALGWRAIVAVEDAAGIADGAPGDYHAHRIALGIPEGGKDFLFSSAFPHEALMDQLAGVDFNKGCYVGQEVVSRMQHRGTARTRLVPVSYPEGAVAETGAPVIAREQGGEDDRALGEAGSGANGRGLVMIRLDRAAEALAAGRVILAGGLPVRLEKPDWLDLPIPSAGTTP